MADRPVLADCCLPTNFIRTRPTLFVPVSDWQAGFVGHEAVGNDAAHQIDQEVGDRAMPGVFDLAKILQFINDRFD